MQFRSRSELSTVLAHLVEAVGQRSDDGLGSEGQRVGRLLDRVQDVEETRMAATLQLAHAVAQHLRNGFLAPRLVQLVGRPLVE